MVLNIDGILLGDQTLAGTVEGAGIGALAEKATLLLAGVALVCGRPKSWLNLALLGAIVVVTLVSACFSRYFGFGWGRYARSLVTLTSALLLLTAPPTLRDQLWMIRVIAFAPLASVILGIAFTAARIHDAWMTDTVGVLRLQASFGSPAWIGALASCALLCSVRLADVVGSRYFLLATINGLVLVLTAARTPIAAGTVLAGAMLLEGFKRQAGRKLLVIGLSGAAVALLLSAYGEQIYLRFTESGSNGRDILWESVGPAMRTFPDWGVGLGHQPEVLPLEVAKEAETFALHNEYKRLALEIGIVPAIMLYALLLTMLLRHLVMERLERPITFLLSVGAFALYCYSDNAFSVPTIFMLLPVSLAVSKHLHVEAPELRAFHETMPQ